MGKEVISRGPGCPGLSRAAQEFVEEVYELRRTGRATTEKLAAAQWKLFASNFRRTFRCCMYYMVCLSVLY
eukprot:COSAG01_NODE_6234_length_3776_cov_65.869731_6_plen_71_part_00